MIRLPHELLTKAGPLTPEERLLMEKHVDYAVEALRGIDFGLPVLQTIEQMHERMDGSGYPRKLQGEAICLQARILAVANTFCALMRPRSYRRRHDEPAALAILRERPSSMTSRWWMPWRRSCKARRVRNSSGYCSNSSIERAVSVPDGEGYRPFSYVMPGAAEPQGIQRFTPSRGCAVRQRRNSSRVRTPPSRTD